MTDFDTDGLEDFFAAARATPPALPAGLQARILADAAAHMPAAPRPWHRALWQLLGGAAGVGGLAMAAAVGVWLGVAPPANLPDLAGQIVSGQISMAESSEYETGALIGVYGWDMEGS
ncbi:hypothetical protein [Sulfitobacter sp. PS-8MA]|uniref:hypothetical protein n=1 Tax=Sulfitobacter sp. PS-8MA TaxID=3237707 RepID=UPI0034C5CD50